MGTVPAKTRGGNHCLISDMHSNGHQHPPTRPEVAHRALVGFLPRVTPHVHYQHVLSLERLLLPGAVLPAANELLLLSVDVIVIDVLAGEGKAGHY